MKSQSSFFDEGPGSGDELVACCLLLVAGCWLLALDSEAESEGVLLAESQITAITGCS